MKPELEWRSTTAPGGQGSEPLAWLHAHGDGWTAAFSSRSGGVSPEPYATLDLSLAVGDQDGNVVENRRRLAAAAGFDAGSLVVPRQVHGTRVATVGEGDAGRGALSVATAPPDTDALVSAAPLLPLMITVADCVPVVLAARRPDGSAAVAAVHAGWRGLAGGVIREAASALGRLGTLTAAVVGPSIGPCCFKVGPDVAATFGQRFQRVVHDDRVDLWSAAEQDLRVAGVPPDGTAVAGLCTMCDARFFSHRGEGGHTGRQAVVAWAYAPASGGHAAGRQ